jgi:transposase
LAHIFSASPSLILDLTPRCSPNARSRLIEKHAEELLLEKMLTLFGQKGWLKARGRQRTDSTHVLAKIRALNRVLCVRETMRAALNSLAVVAPDWLRAHSQQEWVERYGPRSEDSRSPLGEAERLAFARSDRSARKRTA